MAAGGGGDDDDRIDRDRDVELARGIHYRGNKAVTIDLVLYMDCGELYVTCVGRCRFPRPSLHDPVRFSPQSGYHWASPAKEEKKGSLGLLDPVRLVGVEVTTGLLCMPNGKKIRASLP